MGVYRLLYSIRIDNDKRELMIHKTGKGYLMQLYNTREKGHNHIPN